MVLRQQAADGGTSGEVLAILSAIEEIKSLSMADNGLGSLSDALKLIFRRSETSLSSYYKGHFTGPSDSLVPCQPLSEILAMRQAQMSNQLVSSVSIIQANCVVGSTTGFVKESRNGRPNLQMQDGLQSSVQETSKNAGVIDLVSQVKPTLNAKSDTSIPIGGIECDKFKPSPKTLPCKILQRKDIEMLEKPWSLNKHIRRENQDVDKSAGSSIALQGDSKATTSRDNKSGLKHKATLSSRSACRVPEECREKVAEPYLRERNDGNLFGVEQVQEERKTDAQGGVQKALGSTSGQKAKNAAGVLQEVKAHLNVVEYNQFLEHIRGLRNNS